MIPWWMALALAGESLTLDAAWEQATLAPEAALAEVERQLGHAERQEAGAWTNPTLDYQGYGRLQGTADAINAQQHQVDLGIALPVTGELAARLRRGRLAELLGDARADRRSTLLAEAVGAAWVDLLAAQDRARVLDDALARLDGLVALTTHRAEEGAARPWDVDRMRLARLAMARERAHAGQARHAAAADLAALLGRDDPDVHANGDLEAPLRTHRASAAPAASPFVREARLALEHREEGVREARRSRIAEPELRVGGYWTTDGTSASIVAGLGWDLPVFDRGQGRVAQAEAERASAAAEARHVEVRVAAERAALQRALDDLDALASTLPVPEGAVLAAAEVAWTEGEAGILELVDAVSAEVAQRLDALAVHAARRHLELRLAALDGELAAPLSPP
ncbi:MAG: TolC family protein [Alphaproteobacteria bacterium]|nr:TolC family protein [Alphaproteobacteria bacterium]